MGRSSEEDRLLNPTGGAGRAAGLKAFHTRRKEDSRQRLLAAAKALFCHRGYLAVSVEDIATAAGLTRVTFYRHFPSKGDLAVEIFRMEAHAAIGRFMAITTVDFEDLAGVTQWMRSLFEADRANRQLLRVFTQATADDTNFTERAQQLIAELVSKLGEQIPAFSVDPAKPADRRRWLEAWLLIYEILDQSNHAALGSGVATDPIVIDILAERFLRFVTWL